MKNAFAFACSSVLVALFVFACGVAGMIEAAPSGPPASAAVGVSAGATPHIVARIAPCTYEDGSPRSQDRRCFWDAAARGNGSGDSFIGYARKDRDIRVKYISDRYAARLTATWANHTAYLPR